MAYEQKPGDFVLFKNDKGDNAKRPDYRGEGIDLNGQPVEVAGWLKEGKKGKFLSCRMKAKEATAPAPKKPAGKFDDLESDIPF